MNEHLLIDQLGKAEIEVHTPSGLRTIKEARILGDWAAHQTVNNSERWNVTHLPSGRKLPYWFACSRHAILFRDSIAELLEGEGIETGLTDPLSFVAILSPFRSAILPIAAKFAGLPFEPEEAPVD